MLLAPTEERSLLEAAASGFARRARPIPAIRSSARSGEGIPPEYRRGAAELGWFASFVAEEAGGGMSSPSDALNGLVLGRVSGALLQPSNYISTNVVASALAESGEPIALTWLERLIGGECAAGWAFAEPLQNASASLALPAHPIVDGRRLRGTALVHEVGADDVLLVSTIAGTEIIQYVVAVSTPGIRVRPAEGFDITSRFCEIVFDDVTLDDAQRLGAGSETTLRRQLDLAVMLSVADATGAMAELLRMTVDYALVREAFGRLIGSYQAVKHQLADASYQLVSSESVVASLADAHVLQHVALSEIASIAKAWVGDSAYELAQICMQVHGGIAFAWEHDLHLYQRRLAYLSAAYGTATYHRDWIARWHLDAEGDGGR